MKKITLFILVLISLLFAACNFSGSDGKFSGETTTMEVSVYDIMSGLLFEEYDGTVSSGTVGSDQTVEIMENVYTISLEMVGEVPASIKIPEPITGTKLSDFENKSFVFTEIPVGTQLQFKLLVSDLGGELFEGTSDVVTITPAMQTVSIPMNKVYEYLPLYSKGNGYNLTMKNLKNKNDAVALRNFFVSFTTDDESNLYALEYSWSDYMNVVRYSPKNSYVKGDVIAVVSYEFGNDTKLVYDKNNGSIYLLDYYESAPMISEIKNAKTAKPVDKDTEEMTSEVTVIHSMWTAKIYTVYNEKLYFIEDELKDEQDPNAGSNYFLKRYALSELNGEPGNAPLAEKSLLLGSCSAYEKEGESQYCQLLDSSEKLNPSFLSFTDMAVNENGIYILYSEWCENNGVKEGIRNDIYSRGCVIVVGSDMEKASCRTVGLANSKMKCSDSNDSFYAILPKSIDPSVAGSGFYGPERIFAIKEKELVFADNGACPVKYGSSEGKKHLVKLNLDTMSWVAEEVDAGFTEKHFGYSSVSQFDKTEWVD